MKILLDENIPISFLSVLSREGFSVEHVLYTGLIGKTDEAIFNYCKKNKLVFITFDRDFLNDRFLSEKHYGIIVLSLKIENLEKLLQNLIKILQEHKSFRNKVIILE